MSGFDRGDAVALAAATVISGAPSTVHAFVTGRGMLDAARAAGTLVPGRSGRPGVVAGATAHVAISMFWGTLVRLGARRFPRHRVLFGAVAGAGIAAIDLGIFGRRYTALSSLPQVPQWADHIVFGVVAASARP